MSERFLKFATHKHKVQLYRRRRGTFSAHARRIRSWQSWDAARRERAGAEPGRSVVVYLSEIGICLLTVAGSGWRVAGLLRQSPCVRMLVVCHALCASRLVVLPCVCAW